MNRRAFVAAAAGLVAAPSLSVARAAEQPFSNWVKELRRDALAEGVSGATFDAAFRGVAPIDRILELDRKQPEFTLTFEEYQAKLVNDQRVMRGRQLHVDNTVILQQVSARFSVPAQYILALWGIETDYGRLTGGYKVVAALATLAFDGRRSSFFRKELINALRILDKHDVNPDQMLGSWAGAMGQSQFMPSSFLAYAVDFDGDGRRDIWSSRADVLASIANYLNRVGWRGAEGWGVRVAKPAVVPEAALDPQTRLHPAEWENAGFVRLDGGVSARRPEQAASILFPAGADGPAFMLFENYRAILKWNRSNNFAIAVGSLADRIIAG